MFQECQYYLNTLKYLYKVCSRALSMFQKHCTFPDMPRVKVQQFRGMMGLYGQRRVAASGESVGCCISVMTLTPFSLILISLDFLILLLFIMILSNFSRCYVAHHIQRCCETQPFFLASATCGYSLGLGLGVPQLPNSSSRYV